METCVTYHTQKHPYMHDIKGIKEDINVLELQ